METRSLAQQFKLPNANRKDSVGICFIGDRKFSNFLQEYLLTKPGDMITKDGKVIGKHTGLFCYTIGQRKGLGIGGVKGSKETPWYVIAKDMQNNQLIVSQDEQDLLKAHIETLPIHWIRERPSQIQLKAKLRHGPEFVDCILHSDSHIEFVTLKARYAWTTHCLLSKWRMPWRKYDYQDILIVFIRILFPRKIRYNRIMYSESCDP